MIISFDYNDSSSTTVKTTYLILDGEIIILKLEYEECDNNR